MSRFYFCTLLAILLCTCGRDPLSIEEVTVGADAEADGLTELELPKKAVLTEEIVLAEDAKNLTLKMTYKLPAGGGGRLRIAEGTEIDLATLAVSGLKRPTTSAAREVYQDLELSLLAATADRPAILLELYLNDYPIYRRDTLATGMRGFERISLAPSGNGIELASVRTGSFGDEDFMETVDGVTKLKMPKFDGQTKALEPILVSGDERPYILRSFMFFPTPRLYADAESLTHVVSVGEGEGPHYSIDLQTGALLQVWRGPFADAVGMWKGRGHGQVARAAGPALQFDGLPQWSSSAHDAWPRRPEEPDADEFVHHAYELDEACRPTFIYDFENAQVTDHLMPSGRGLVRELTCSGAGVNVYTVVASAAEIQELAPGQFELRSPGAKINIESYDGAGLFRQTGANGHQRLIAQLSEAGHLTYRIDW